MRGIPREAVAALAALAALSGCARAGRAVTVQPPTADPATVRLCTTLHARLPAKLDGQPVRETRPKSALTQAWGKQPIILRCGVPRPATLQPMSELVVINGVSWLPIPAERPNRFTAVGRRVYVEVAVPSSYSPQSDVLVELARPIASTIPANPGGLP